MKLSLLELGDVRCRLAETFGDFWRILQQLLANFAATFAAINGDFYSDF
jgi:hypothetical protein